MRGKKECTKNRHSLVGIWWSVFPQPHRKKAECEKDHDTGKNIKKDIRDMIAKRVQLPKIVIDGIAEDPDRLVSIATFKSEYLLETLPIQIPDRRILVNHPIIPICELVPQRIEVEDGDH